MQLWQEKHRSILGTTSRKTQLLLDQQDYIAQVSEKIEGRVTKNLSQEFSRTESRVLGALSELDEFLLNPQIRIFSGTTPASFRNTDVENQEANGDRSQNDPHPEMEFSACRVSNLTDLDPDETSHTNPFFPERASYMHSRRNLRTYNRIYFCRKRLRSQLPETVRLKLFCRKLRKMNEIYFWREVIKSNFPQSVISKFPWSKVAEKIRWGPELEDTEFRAVQPCVRENQDWLKLFQKALAVISSVSDKISAETVLIQSWIFCSENFAFERCFRESQLWSAFNQLFFRKNQCWFNADFLVWNLGFSALFRDFQVLNSVESEFKPFWIRADQRWFVLGLQPG